MGPSVNMAITYAVILRITTCIFLTLSCIILLPRINGKWSLTMLRSVSIM